MPFGLSYALATLPSYINDCLRPYIDDFTVCYLHNIPISSTNETEQEGIYVPSAAPTEGIQPVLQR